MCWTSMLEVQSMMRKCTHEPTSASEGHIGSHALGFRGEGHTCASVQALVMLWVPRKDSTILLPLHASTACHSMSQPSQFSALRDHHACNLHVASSQITRPVQNFVHWQIFLTYTVKYPFSEHCPLPNKTNRLAGSFAYRNPIVQYPDRPSHDPLC
jgi:hypothetical protein